MPNLDDIEHVSDQNHAKYRSCLGCCLFAAHLILCVVPFWTYSCLCSWQEMSNLLFCCSFGTELFHTKHCILSIHSTPERLNLNWVVYAIWVLTVFNSSIFLTMSSWLLQLFSYEHWMSPLWQELCSEVILHSCMNSCHGRCDVFVTVCTLDLLYHQHSKAAIMVSISLPTVQFFSIHFLW
jgi:hypothetical protein